MKNRPRYFIIYSGFLGLAAISYFLHLFGANLAVFQDFPHVLGETNPLNLSLLATLILGAFLSFNASPALRLTIPLLLLLVGMNNYIDGLKPIDHGGALAHLIMFGVVLIHLPLFAAQTRLAIMHSRTRWWLVPHRKLLNISVSLQPVHGQNFTAKTFDISEKGIFVSLDEKVLESGNQGFLKPLLKGSRINVRLALSRFRDIECQAHVVRLQKKHRGQYPSGIGIRFLKLDPEARANIQRAMTHMSQMSPSRN